jgi:hypothetical protein
MSFKQEINKQEKEILDHLMESKFIASFTEVDSETGEYIRDIKEADEEDNGCSEKKADHKGRQAAGI